MLKISSLDAVLTTCIRVNNDKDESKIVKQLEFVDYLPKGQLHRNERCLLISAYTSYTLTESRCIPAGT